jgi:TolA-binding protein
MKRVFGKSCALAALLTLFLMPCRAQDPAAAAEDPNVTLYKNGIAAFEAGNFQQAAESLSKVITAVGTPQPALEPAYFDLAVAYYNLQKYAEAADAFKSYLAKYPQGSRVPDATMSLANCYLGTKNFDAALKELQAVSSLPGQREQALLLQGSILAEQKKVPQAIQALEELTKGGMRSSMGARGALLLASLYVEKADFVKANALVVTIQRNLALVDNILRFNGLIIELGDKLLTQGLYSQALALYHIARTRKEVIQYQNERLVNLQKSIEENKLKFRATKDPSVLSNNQYLLTAIAEAKKTLDDIQKAPNFEPALYFRMARAYQETDKQWEAALVYQQIVDKYPDAKAEREPALFGLIAVLADLGKSKRAFEACETYLKTFPQGPNASAVAYLRGAMALDAGDFSQAISYFGSAVKEQASGPFRDRMSFMLGNARFLSGDAKAALSSYEQYLKDFPKGDYVEEATYRIGICQMFSDQYEAAEKQLNAYLKQYPKGEFGPDARYRLAVIKYAAQEYDQVLPECMAWLKANPGGQQTAEVLSLLGDTYAATEKKDQAADAYIRAYKAALENNNDEVLNYALFEAGKLLGKMGQWEKVAATFEEFLKNNPEHPLTPAAVANIIQARAKLGQVDQAKAFAAQTIAKYIADPSKETVENLITQLAALCARKRQPGADPAADLEKLLTFAPEANVPDTATVRARRLYAQAELMTLLRKPKEHDALIAKIANESKPADLSPLLLGLTGESLLGQDRPIPARAMFEQLIAKHQKSDVLDFGYVGLGELAYREGDYPKALGLFTKAVDEIASAYRIKEATIGKAKTMLALNRLDEAAKLFEEVASVKAWRGEATAQALYMLGDIEAKRGDQNKAIAYYQRVYVAYQKYPRWMAKAYIESARAFEKLGKTQEAINTYREMVHNEKIADLGEVEEARKRLTELGQS